MSWKRGLGICLLLVVILTAPAAAQTLGEPPVLAEQVAQGELPPMAERLPEDPLVVEPIEEIGRYGGTLNTATLTINGWGDHLAAYDFMVALVAPEAGGGGVVPNLARKVEFSDDMTEFTFYLRRGTKWSDGHPFTTADIAFWYNDVLLNKDLMPSIPQFMQTGEDKVAELEVVDDYTFRLVYQEPQPFLLESIAFQGGAFALPSHYLKKYHINYADPEELAVLIQEEGFEEWYELFGYMNSSIMQVPLIPERPTLAAYRLVSRTSERLVYERNPYFWKVDTEGNQLPYIDRLVGNLAADLEVVQGQIMSGEIDFASRLVDIRNYPMYRRYEEAGGYRTLLWEQALGSEVIYQFNLTHEDPVLREIFQDVRFRRAMSLAIDREEINDVVYYGQGTPRQHTVIPTSKYYRDEFGEAYAQYDPEEANRLLDEMGLDKRDSEGFRLRPDGERLVFTVEYTQRPYPVVPNVELVTMAWQEVGIDARSRQVSGELQSQRAPANMMDSSIWGGDAVTDLMFPHNNTMIIPVQPHWGSTIWPLWEQWLATEGQEGEEPPQEVKRLNDARRLAMKEPDEERRNELITEILESQAENLWVIGTVGLSPRPVIVNAKLRNVPEENLWAWDTWTGCHANLEQMFFGE